MPPEDDKKKPKPAPKPDDKPDDDDELGEKGKRALDRERAARRDAEAKIKELEPLAAKVKELEDADKSEVAKLTERVTAAEKRANDADLHALRIEVALDKGLNRSQAKRLVGTTKEELEEDADASIEDGTFTVGDGGGGDDKKKPPPSNKPKPDLKTGSEPDDDAEVVDPAKLAEAIPRP